MVNKLTIKNLDKRLNDITTRVHRNAILSIANEHRIGVNNNKRKQHIKYLGVIGLFLLFGFVTQLMIILSMVTNHTISMLLFATLNITCALAAMVVIFRLVQKTFRGDFN